MGSPLEAGSLQKPGAGRVLGRLPQGRDVHQLRPGGGGGPQRAHEEARHLH